MVWNAGKFCKGCTDKAAGCHARCFAYQVAKAKYDAEQRNINHAKKSEKESLDYTVEKALNNRRKYGKH